MTITIRTLGVIMSAELRAFMPRQFFPLKEAMVLLATCFVTFNIRLFLRRFNVDRIIATLNDWVGFEKTLIALCG